MRPGYKTTEFWLTALAAIVGLTYASGLISDGSGWDKALAFIASALATAGYTVSRGMSKGALPAGKR